MSKKKETFGGTARRIIIPVFLIAVSFFLIEVFSWYFLEGADRWPLTFGALWAVVLTCLICLVPGKAGRIAYGCAYFLAVIYAVGQTGYYILFGQMMWLSDFRYASEGASYLDILLAYPAAWWVSVPSLIGVGVLLLWKYPMRTAKWYGYVFAAILIGICVSNFRSMPEQVFDRDESVRFARSDYGRMQSARAAYENMFNAHRLYEICGLYHTAFKDVYTHYLYPATPAYRASQEKSMEQVHVYLESQPERMPNEMTGVLQGKNVVLVLMESMDDWMIGEHTPTIRRLMGEGIRFTKFFTPGYGGIRTFNTEFCINTGSFLSSQGGYAFDYVTNHFNQSLASLMRNAGTSALTFHYNEPSFYSRGVFSPAMGYEQYVSYQAYTTDKDALYDDQYLFDDPSLRELFFRPGQKLNFVITRSAHLSYKYNEVLSYWGLKKYPEYRGLTDNEETNCALLKARLVDDFFARLLQELEQEGELENTVIVGVTDHYTYGYKNEEALLELSGVQEKLLLERTPCFIWSPGLEGREVDKILNTSDLMPTLLNMLGLDAPCRYIGRDAFDERYDGFVPFSNGSWIYGDLAYDAEAGRVFTLDSEPAAISDELRTQMEERVQAFIRANNLILQTDYYKNSR